MSIAKIVEEVIEEQPMLMLALEEELLNYSACANYIRGTVERRAGKKVSVESILMALRRLSFVHVKTLTREIKKAIERSTYSIHSGLYDVVIDYELATLKKIAGMEGKGEGEIFSFIIGTKYASLITDQPELVKNIKKTKEIEIVDIVDHLVIFRIILNKKDIRLPGIISIFAREFTKAGISITELESTYTEIGFIIPEKDVKKAIDAYTSMKERMKND